MKVFKISGRFLMLCALGLATTISLSSDSCGSDDSPSSSSSSGGDNAGRQQQWRQQSFCHGSLAINLFQ
ncbi:MAG: hypothetical protein II136_05275 [Prevotella sp.]|nr:hypothetical protein [Prevotella sp.]